MRAIDFCNCSLQICILGVRPIAKRLACMTFQSHANENVKIPVDLCKKHLRTRLAQISSSGVWQSTSSERLIQHSSAHFHALPSSNPCGSGLHSVTHKKKLGVDCVACFSCRFVWPNWVSSSPTTFRDSIPDRNFHFHISD